MLNLMHFLTKWLIYFSSYILIYSQLRDHELLACAVRKNKASKRRLKENMTNCSNSDSYQKTLNVHFKRLNCKK